MEHNFELLPEPETNAITHDNLLLEVKGIYASLVMVENKCINVDANQSKAALEQDPSKPRKLSNEQWRALIALHQTLLHEHHDFFLASQHPSANPALTRLAEHYSMPARMWRHGIHTFLEVLRHRLPDSIDHMLAFISIAYSMMCLLYETVPAFQDTWTECLGDLGRYRMAIEDVGQDRNVWNGVARFWYSKGVDMNPDQGRLYHHLAVLARGSSLQQLALYSKALSCMIPFESARTGILTLFNPILRGRESSYLQRTVPLEFIFIKAHAILFTGTAVEFYDATVSRLIDLLDRYITKIAFKFRQQGAFIAIANLSSLFEYCGDLRPPGASRSILQLCFSSLRNAEVRAINEAKVEDVDQGLVVAVESVKPDASYIESIPPSELETSLQFITRALKLAFGTFSITLQHVGDENVIPLIGVYLVLIWDLTRIEDLHGVKTLLNREVPWREMCSFLNALITPETLAPRVRAPLFPTHERPLPEDFLMRGQPYFPPHRLSRIRIDEEERTIEMPSNGPTRVQRILWLGFHMAASSDNEFIFFDERLQKFTIDDPAQDPRVPISVPSKAQRISLPRSPDDPAASTTDEKAEEHESAILDLADSLNMAMHPISSPPAGSSPTESIHPEATVSEDGLPDIMTDAASQNLFAKETKREASGYRRSNLTEGLRLFKSFSDGRRMIPEPKLSTTTSQLQKMRFGRIRALDNGPNGQGLSTV